MPNWCANQLTVEGNSELLESFVKQARANGSHDLSLEKFLPTPEQEEQDAWYYWRLKNWGVKWDLDGVLTIEDSERVVYEFQSPWAPPIEGFVNISRKYPALIFTLEYFEGGCGFGGLVSILNGEITNEIEGEDLEWLASNTDLPFASMEASTLLEIMENDI